MEDLNALEYTMVLVSSVAFGGLMPNIIAGTMATFIMAWMLVIILFHYKNDGGWRW